MLLKITTGDVNHLPYTGAWVLPKIATGGGIVPNVQSRPSYYGTPMEPKIVTV